MSQLPRFNFFTELRPSAEKDADIAELVNNVRLLDVTCTANGDGYVFLGDSEGGITVIDHKFRVTRSLLFAGCVSHLRYIKERNTLMAIGNCRDQRDSQHQSSSQKKIESHRQKMLEVNPTIFSTLSLTQPMQKSDEGSPEVQLFSLMKERFKLDKRGTVKLPEDKSITAFAVTESLNFLIVGYASGKLYFNQGDLLRYQAQQLPIYDHGKAAITYLCMVDGFNHPAVMCVTPSNIHLFEFEKGSKKPAVQEIGQGQGGRQNCVGWDGDQLVIGEESAFHFCTVETLGGNYPNSSKIHQMTCIRKRYIFSGENEQNQSTLTCLDFDKKFISFTFVSPKQKITQFVLEGDFLFVICADGNMSIFKEKDIKEKLDTLFEKSLFPAAIQLVEGCPDHKSKIPDIYKRYGEDCYKKGDYTLAIENFCKTIGTVEPSSVIQKFLDSQKIGYLTKYLEALHDAGFQNTNHTILLINCFTKLRKEESINKYIERMTGSTPGSTAKEDKSCSPSQALIVIDKEADQETLIDVLCTGGFYKQAADLCERFHRHDSYVRIQCEYIKDYKGALVYIKKLSSEEQVKQMKSYGKLLINESPDEATTLLIGICSNPEMKNTLADEFLYCFVDKKDKLKEFLSAVTDKREECSAEIWNTLFDLTQSSSNSDDDIYNFLKNPKAAFNPHFALALLRSSGHRRSIIELYKRLHLRQLELQYYLEEQDHKAVMDLLRASQNDAVDHNLWIKVLHNYSSRPPQEDESKQSQFNTELRDLLSEIERQDLFPPLQVLRILEKSKSIPLSVVKRYILNQLQRERKIIIKTTLDIQRYQTDIEKYRSELHEIQTKPRIFQYSKCTRCSAPLDLPAIHFMCMHSYHERCLGDNDRECPRCSSDQQYAVDSTAHPLPPSELRSRRQNLEQQSSNEESLLQELRNSRDGFTTITSFFSRGLFSRLRKNPKESVLGSTESMSEGDLMKLSEELIPHNPDAKRSNASSAALSGTSQHRSPSAAEIIPDSEFGSVDDWAQHSEKRGIAPKASDPQEKKSSEPVHILPKTSLFEWLKKTPL